MKRIIAQTAVSLGASAALVAGANAANVPESVQWAAIAGTAGAAVAVVTKRGG